MQPQFSVCGAHKTILLLQVLHILHSPDLLLILSDFADFIVCGFNVAVLSMCLEIQIITNAFVSGVCHNVPVASALHSLDMVQERHERSAVCAVGERLSLIHI